MASKSLTEVIELVKIVRPIAPKRILEWTEKQDGQEVRLYHRLAASQEAATDIALLEYLGLERPRFRQLLSQLKSRLLDALLEIELPKARYSDYARGQLKLDRTSTSLRLLARLGGTQTASSEARHWLDEAIKFEEWHTALSFFTPLLNWATLSGDVEEYDSLQSKQLRVRSIDAALRDAEEIIQRARMAFAKSGAEHPEL
ncbi:MAG: hypothetical protein ACRDF4_05945 [Rhabdochlamydiaceae bacterium]